MPGAGHVTPRDAEPKWTASLGMHSSLRTACVMGHDSHRESVQYEMTDEPSALHVVLYPTYAPSGAGTSWHAPCTMTTRDSIPGEHAGSAYHVRSASV